MISVGSAQPLPQGCLDSRSNGNVDLHRFLAVADGVVRAERRAAGPQPGVAGVVHRRKCFWEPLEYLFICAVNSGGCRAL
jgi:hypothetical protein